MRNLQLAWRRILHAPIVTLVAVVSLALGIGGNTALFSLFEEMLPRPLPVRSPHELVNFLSTIPSTIKRLDATLPVDDLKTMTVQVAENVTLDRLLGTLFAASASLATGVAALGLCGVLAYTVAQRTREVGLRMALGADAGRVRRMVLAQVGRMTVAGAAIALVAALGLGRLAQSLLFELDGRDLGVFAPAAGILAAVALGAGLISARQASGLDPLRALRHA